MWFCCIICPKESKGQSEESQCTSVGPEVGLPTDFCPSCCSQPPISAAGNPSGVALALGSRRHLKGRLGE